MTHPAGRMFPIQGADPIPWDAAEKAYVAYARLFGKQQSLERLAERGGFGLHEWACLYEGHGPLGYHSPILADRCVMRALAAVAARPDALIQRGLPDTAIAVVARVLDRWHLYRCYEIAQEIVAALRGLDAGPPPPDAQKLTDREALRIVDDCLGDHTTTNHESLAESGRCDLCAALEAVREALRASPSEPPPDGWRLWGDAPKNGEEILVWVQRANIPSALVVHYQPGGHCIEDHPPIAEGWYFWTGCQFAPIDRVPTHWMPLRPRPTPGEGMARRVAEGSPQ